MEIRVTRFREIMDLLKPAVARKPTIESLSKIMLKDGKAVATDMATMVITEVPEINITSLIPHNEVLKVLQYVNGSNMLHIKKKAGQVSLSWEDGSATFPVEEPDTFPDIPEFVPESEEPLNTDILIPGMVMVKPYASKENERPVLAGINLILGDPIRVAAGDGFRMAEKELPISYSKEIVVIIPSSSVSVLEHLWKKTPRTPAPAEALVPIIMSKKYARVGYDGKSGLRFQFERGTTAIVKLINGKPPDWLKIIPKEEPILQVQMLADDLLLAVRRVQEVAQQKKEGMVHIAFDNTTAIISAKSDGNEVKSSINTLSCNGQPNKMALNVSYLMGYLGDKQGIITISWTGGTAPVCFQSHNQPRVLIMPMKA